MKCYFCDFTSKAAFSCTCLDCCEKYDLIQVQSKIVQRTKDKSVETKYASVIFNLEGRVYETIIYFYADSTSKTTIWWHPSAEDAAPVKVGWFEGIAFTLDNIRKRIKTCLVFL